MRRTVSLIAAALALPLTAGAKPVIDNQGYAHISADLLGSRAGDKSQHIEFQSYSFGALNAESGHSMLGASDRVGARTEGPGTLVIKGRLPGCTVGTRYGGMEFAASSKKYELQGVVIDTCGPDGATFSYRKVTVRGWNPETKEL
jgi:hypothetical protein